MKLVLVSITMAVTILTLNVNGLRETCSDSSVAASAALGTGCCLSQEKHCTSLSEGNTWFLSSGFEYSVSPGTGRAAGCFFLFRPPLSMEAF